jgi:hypothetical protein
MPDFFGGNTGLTSYDAGWLYALPPAATNPGTVASSPGPCDNAWCAITNGLNAAAGAFNSYEQNDVANAAIAANSNVQFRTGGIQSVGGLGGLNLGGLLPILLIIVGMVLVFKLVSK